MSLASTKIIQAIAKECRTTPEAISLDANLALIGLGGYSLQRVMWEAGIDVSLSECANLFERVSCLVEYADAHDARVVPQNLRYPESQADPGESRAGEKRFPNLLTFGDSGSIFYP